MSKTDAYGGKSGNASLPYLGSSFWVHHPASAYAMIGSDGWISAFLCATAHICVFLYLHDRAIDFDGRAGQHKSTRIPQTYATTISLVLVTSFRAALVACINVCHTQYLWKNLRAQPHEVGLIERLFQIRSNPFLLFSRRLLIASPLLVGITVISWLVPVALVYPPGALVVDQERLLVESTFNVSVFKPDSRIELSRDPSTVAQYNGFAEIMPRGPGEDWTQFYANKTINCKVTICAYR
jgi:hypothetical protein